MGFFDFLFNNGSGIKTDNNIGPTQSRPLDFQPYNEEFSMDMTTEPYGSNMFESNNTFSNNGVELQDARNTLRLVYSGILAKDSADELYAVVGYGNNLAWEDTESYPMHKISHDKFELMLPVKRPGNINIAFKDGAENWDNNFGMNYSFKNYVYEGSQ